MAIHELNPGAGVITAKMNEVGTVNGDIIRLNPGTYTETNITMAKELTIEALAPGSYPRVETAVAGYGSSWLINASNVTFKGIELSNPVSSNSYFWRSTGAQTNFTAEDCKVDGMRRSRLGYSGGIDGILIKDCVFRNQAKEPLTLEGPNRNVTISGNRFDAATAGAEGAIQYSGIPADCGTCLIEKNIIIGHRVGIGLNAGVANAASVGSITLDHNTIDMAMSAEKPDSSWPYYRSTYGISFWSGNGNSFDGANILVKNSIFSRMRWTMTYGSDWAVLNSPVTFQNCLFFDNGWYFWPQYRAAFEQLSSNSSLTNTNVGLETSSGKTAHAAEFVPSHDNRHQDLTSRSGYLEPHYKNMPHPKSSRQVIGLFNADESLTLIDCLETSPMFEETGATHSDWYKLKAGSSALNAATDGGNIGADTP